MPSGIPSPAPSAVGSLFSLVSVLAVPLRVATDVSTIEVVVDTERVDLAKGDDDPVVESTELDDPPDLMTFPTLAEGQMVKVALLPDLQGVVSCSSPAHQGPPRLPREDPQNHMLAHESG